MNLKLSMSLSFHLNMKKGSYLISTSLSWKNYNFLSNHTPNLLVTSLLVTLIRYLIWLILSISYRTLNNVRFKKSSICTYQALRITHKTHIGLIHRKYFSNSIVWLSILQWLQKNSWNHFVRYISMYLSFTAINK